MSSLKLKEGQVVNGRPTQKEALPAERWALIKRARTGETDAIASLYDEAMAGSWSAHARMASSNRANCWR